MLPPTSLHINREKGSNTMWHLERLAIRKGTDELVLPKWWPNCFVTTRSSHNGQRAIDTIVFTPKPGISVAKAAAFYQDDTVLHVLKIGRGDYTRFMTIKESRTIGVSDVVVIISEEEFQGLAWPALASNAPVTVTPDPFEDLGPVPVSVVQDSQALAQSAMALLEEKPTKPRAARRSSEAPQGKARSKKAEAVAA